MRTRFDKAFALCIAGFLFPAAAQAQPCTQDQTIGAVSAGGFPQVLAISAGQTAGQSFVAPCDGVLEAISVALANHTADPTVRATYIVFRGEPNTVPGDAITLPPQALVATNSQVRVYTFEVPEPFAVHAGEVISYFGITDTNGGSVSAGYREPYLPGQTLYEVYPLGEPSLEAGANIRYSDAADAIFEARFGLGVSVSNEAAPESGGPMLTVFPNPAQSQATLRFAVAEAGEAKLAVYDALGREVARPFVGSVSDAVEASFDASGLPAGVYVARLTTARGTETVRLSVVR